MANKNGPGFYLLSFYTTGNIAVTKFNADYSIARIDSFQIKDTINNYAVPSQDAFDYNSPDTIYCIASFWLPNINPWDGADSVGRTENFTVVQFDTTGNLHWRKVVGRENAVYFPYHVIATKDGGALIFSWLYDSQYSTSIHSRLSVIKIGADGSVLHDNEYDLPNSNGLAFYPNPVGELLNIKLPEELEIAGEYSIFSITGSNQLRGHFTPDKPIEVDHLLPGSYIIHLQLENGFVQSGRFVKE